MTPSSKQPTRPTDVLEESRGSAIPGRFPLLEVLDDASLRGNLDRRNGKMYDERLN